jgi:Serine dehydrogenase proteinase
VDPLNLLWLFFILASLQPAFTRQVLLAQRRYALSAISRKRKTTVITLINRQESLSLLGFPIVRYIDIDDAESVLRAIRDSPAGRPIEIILHTPGGPRAQRSPGVESCGAAFAGDERPQDPDRRRALTPTPAERKPRRLALARGLPARRRTHSLTRPRRLVLPRLPANRTVTASTGSPPDRARKVKQLRRPAITRRGETLSRSRKGPGTEEIRPRNIEPVPRPGVFRQVQLPVARAKSSVRQRPRACWPYAFGWNSSSMVPPWKIALGPTNRAHSLLTGDGGCERSASLVDFEHISRPWRASRRSMNCTRLLRATAARLASILGTIESRAQLESAS